MSSTALGSAERHERLRITRRVTLFGSLVDAVLGVLKLTVGYAAHSQALIADGLHSLSDLATDALVLFAAQHAGAEADDEHPYGHDRIETMATVLLGLSLTAVGVFIAYDSANRMLHPEALLRPESWALWVAALSVVAKEAMYHYTVHYARIVHSRLMEANAWHSRSDAISSVVVMIGLLGTMAGFVYVDAIAAVVVAAMIARIGWRFAWRSARELVDTGLDEEALELIRASIMAVDGVGALHELRTRRMGTRALVDVHIILADPRVSVSEGHQVSETVRARIIKNVDDVTEVMVHIDPEDDEDNPPGVHLPNRARLRAELQACWAEVPGADRVEGLTLHYLAGHVHIEGRVRASRLADTDPQALRLALARAAKVLPAVGEVSLVVIQDGS